MTTINDIKYVDWQFKLNGIGEVAEGVEDITIQLIPFFLIP